MRRGGGKVLDFVLQTIGLTKKYKGVPVLNNVGLNVPRGSVYGLIGPNGAGKSTLLRIFTGSVLPTDGYIAINGKTEYDDVENERKKIGSIIESPSLYTHMSAIDNMIARCKLLGISDCVEKSSVSLRTVGLDPCDKKKVKNFSLGMKQRLALALALLNKSEILILDEPTNGLDPIGIAELRRLLKTLNEQGITVLISSHILSELTKVATHYGVLCGGKLLKEISAAEIENSVKNVMEIAFGDVLSLSKAIVLLQPLFAAESFKSNGNNVLQIVLSQSLTAEEVEKLLEDNGIAFSSISFAKGDIEGYLLKTLNVGGIENA